YAPYSQFLVGAALLCTDGTLYTGCNIENISYSGTVCAERTAIFKAVSDGKREFSKIAIVGGKKGETISAYPCGICRQVMAEFCKADFKVIVAKSEEDYEEFSLSELLPKSFDF
ncbi:MAG: cytidine deaminase, partial [Oscillospiraceae bacterium]|nr:cytidine deaminase [Oscillospiraceae bacterium]